MILRLFEILYFSNNGEIFIYKILAIQFHGKSTAGKN